MDTKAKFIRVWTLYILVASVLVTIFAVFSGILKTLYWENQIDFGQLTAIIAATLYIAWFALNHMVRWYKRNNRVCSWI